MAASRQDTRPFSKEYSRIFLLYPIQTDSESSDHYKTDWT